MAQILTGGGLLGTGSSLSPLSVDVPGLAGALGGARVIGAEGSVHSSTSAGTVQVDATASEGAIRFGAASATSGGTLWRVQMSELGAPAGISRTVVKLRAKVTNNLSGSVMANLRCGAIRGGATSFVNVGGPTEIRPNQFSSGVWRELTLHCDFLPTDVDQFIAVENFATGITGLSPDYARVQPATTTEVAQQQWGWIPRQPLNNLRQEGWDNLLIRGSLYMNSSCTTSANGQNNCHEWCAAQCLRQGMANCGGCCSGLAVYYTNGVVHLLLTR
jgi:hypothetical protein